MQENYYKIGLPPKIRFRSVIIFNILTIGFFSFFISGVYAGVKSGRLNEAIVKPLAKFVEELQAEDKYAKPLTEDYPSFNSTSSSEVNIEINTNQGSGSDNNSSNKSFYKYNPTPYPTIPTKSWEQIKKEQDEWWAKVQEENKQLSEQSKKEFERFRQESQKIFEEIKRQEELDSIEFGKNAEEWQQQKLEEFKQKYGIQ